ncbi:Permease of the drug/metabolite transporter (DMT) superfamily [Anaerocolumna jejuensis DSM 15929]|uniref:Permease of the drug/metabolite transporter (DMT) superfamily n=1 Tax=Anaerocolumna jejuensis DSM 15929 TaxID=1121322 RepID=A0A1M6PJ29_9FIRM|nr:DMT family transporter [Anaerocolumna jejuensis]SHK07941.1 Permease of the drug/metabolite transporter (DMT) superfamily [Anaerocolumna jejuensis DSM 15929]
MSSSQNIKGHIAALFSVIFWGTTFISTKVLLKDFSPFEILILRFFIGYIALWCIKPTKGTKLPGQKKSDEWLFLGAGLSGVTLYFLMENNALTLTYASDVGVIVSTAPFFTALMAHFLLKNERFRPSFFLGFLAAMAGIFLISYNGSTALSLNPMGDLLALAAAFVWGIYSIFTKKISDLGYNMAIATRKIFLYGLLTMLPLIPVFRPSFDYKELIKPVTLGNLLYLSLGASALCYVIWNWATKILGAVKTSLYIYVIPVIAIITSAIFLHEKMTLISSIGTLLTIAGLVISENPLAKRKAV